MNRESLRRSGTFILAFILALAVTANAADSFVWITRTPCPLVRFEGIGGACAGRLYQFSGYYTGGSAIKATPECDAYDPATNRWTRLTDIPQPISHSGQAVDDDAPGDEVFWLAGGFLGDHPGPSTTEVWKYSVKDNAWTPGPPLPEERGGGALARIGRELHYFGGVVRKNGVALQDYGTHWALDLDGGTAWRTITTAGDLLAPLPNPRNHMGGVALEGKIYAIGGQHLDDETYGAQDEVDVYDPSTNSWSQTAPMPRPIGHITSSVFARNGRLDVVTGVTNNSVELANVIEFDPSANTWSELPALPAARQSPVAGVVGDQLVVTSGSTDSGKEIPQAQTWVTSLSGSFPDPWRDQDIGNVASGGFASSSDYSSSFSLAGSGSGIAGNADGCNYTWQTLHGNGTAIVRLTSQQAASKFAQAGLMIRETLDPSSKGAAIVMTLGNGLSFQRRLTPGGATTQTYVSGGGIAAPCWLKLVRAADTFTAFYKTTGATWIRVGSSKIPMTADVCIGLAVSSGDSSLATASFSSLNLAPQPDAGADLLTTLPSKGVLRRAASDDGLPGGVLSYNWKKVSGPGTVTFSATNTSDTLASFSATGTYTLSLTANDTTLSAVDKLTVIVNPAP